MNDITYGGQPPRYEEEPRAAAPYGPPVQYQGGSVSSQELSQQILMGMQRDIEAQIDWRLKQRQGKTRGLASSEIGVILGSIGIAIPLMAIAASAAGLPGLIVIAVMLISINGAWAARS